MFQKLYGCNGNLKQNLNSKNSIIFQNESIIFSSFCFDMNIEQNKGVPEDKKGRSIKTLP